MSLMWGENERTLPPAEVCGSSWQGGTLRWEQTRVDSWRRPTCIWERKPVWALPEPMCAWAIPDGETGCHIGGFWGQGLKESLLCPQVVSFSQGTQGRFRCELPRTV